jgi:hypothetical protein
MTEDALLRWCVRFEGGSSGYSVAIRPPGLGDFLDSWVDTAGEAVDLVESCTHHFLLDPEMPPEIRYELERRGIRPQVGH